MKKSTKIILTIVVVVGVSYLVIVSSNSLPVLIKMRNRIPF